jgi:hypothetical protein
MEGRTLSLTERETKSAKGTNQTRRKKIAWFNDVGKCVDGEMCG